MFSGNLGQAIQACGNLTAQQVANMPGPWYYQQQAQQQQMAHAHAQQQYQPLTWMIDGKSMAFKEFVDTIFPEDTPEKTHFILKYTKE